MVAKRGQRLHDDGVGPIGEAESGGEMRVQVGAYIVRLVCRRWLRELVTPCGGIRAGVDGGGVAGLGHVPAGEVEEVDRLFENPATDPLAVVAPAAGALAIGKTG